MLNLILKFEPNQTYGFREIDSLFLIVFCQYIDDELNEENWQIVSLILIFVKILPIFEEIISKRV